MFLEGRTQSRIPQRFLVQISPVHDPLLAELVSVENLSSRGARITSQRPWELGCHVDLKSRVGELHARARIVYCQAIGSKTFAVGLNFRAQTSEWEARGDRYTPQPPS